MTEEKFLLHWNRDFAWSSAVLEMKPLSGYTYKRCYFLLKWNCVVQQMFGIRRPPLLDSHETGICLECEMLTLQRPNCDWVLGRQAIRANFLPGLHLYSLKSSKSSLQACNTPPFLQPALSSAFVCSEHAECPRRVCREESNTYWLRQRALASSLKRKHQ